LLLCNVKIHKRSQHPHAKAARLPVLGLAVSKQFAQWDPVGDEI
jgi:hypothetical protein